MARVNLNGEGHLQKPELPCMEEATKTPVTLPKQLKASDAEIGETVDMTTVVVLQQ